MKTKNWKRLLALMIAIATIVSGMPARVSAKLRNTVTVSTQKSLEEALMDKDVEEIVIKTSKSRVLTVTKIVNKNVKIQVRAPKAKIINRSSDLKSVTIKAVKSYYEYGNGITINVNGLDEKIVLGKKSRNVNININKKDSKITIVSNSGGGSRININKPAELLIRGAASKTTRVINKSEGTKIEAFLRTTITSHKNAYIIFGEGAENSTVWSDVKSSAVLCKNETSNDVKAMDYKKNRTIIPSGKEALISEQGVYIQSAEDGKINDNDISDQDVSGENSSSGNAGETNYNGGVSYGGGTNYGGGSSTGGNTSTGAENRVAVYSRGEWITLLAQKFDFNIEGDMDASNCFFADTATDTIYGKVAELAQVYDILPEYNDGADNYFGADKPVTREYAAYTTMNALGFIEDNSIVVDCLDKEALLYPTWDMMAVKQGALSLVANNFLPEAVMTKEESARVINYIDKVIDSQTVNTTINHQEINYNENVIGRENFNGIPYAIVEGETDKDYSLNIEKTDKTQKLKMGDIFILPANEKNDVDLALKVRSVSEKTDGTLEIDCMKPELYEVASELKFEGKVYPDTSSFEVYEGVEIETMSPASYRNDMSICRNFIVERWDSFDHVIQTPSNAKLVLSINKKLSENLKIVGKLDFSISEIDCKLDTLVDENGNNIRDFVFKVKDNMKTSFSFESTFDNNNSNVENIIPLGRLNVPIAGGFYVGLIMYLKAEVSGKVSVGWSMDCSRGIQITNGMPHIIKDYSVSWDDSINATVEAKIGPSFNFVLAWSGFDLFGIDLYGGVKASAQTVYHTLSDLTCTNLKVFFFAELGLSEKTVTDGLIKALTYDDKLGLKGSIKISLLGGEDGFNPFVLKRHMENGKIVPECTYGMGAIEGVVLDAERVPVKNAKVEVLKDGEVIREATTDENGKYIVSEILAGEYKIRVSSLGVKTKIKDLIVSNGTMTTLDIEVESLDYGNNDNAGSDSGSSAHGEWSVVQGELILGEGYYEFTAQQELSQSHMNHIEVYSEGDSNVSYCVVNENTKWMQNSVINRDYSGAKWWETIQIINFDNQNKQTTFLTVNSGSVKLKVREGSEDAGKLLMRKNTEDFYSGFRVDAGQCAKVTCVSPYYALNMYCDEWEGTVVRMSDNEVMVNATDEFNGARAISSAKFSEKNVNEDYLIKSQAGSIYAFVYWEEKDCVTIDLYDME